jgi:hypothetical protein
VKIHTDTLTTQDIRECVPHGCYLENFIGKNGHEVLIDQAGSRSHERAYEVRMSGSSRHTMDSRRMNYTAKSATWDEWGIFIANVFRREITAKVGWYKSLDHFIEVTKAERDRISENRPDLAPTHRAPWLDDNDLIFASARGYYGTKPLTQTETVAMFRAIDEARANNLR